MAFLCETKEWYIIRKEFFNQNIYNKTVKYLRAKMKKLTKLTIESTKNNS